ncbi:MAG: serpin family protein [Mucilaginibacter sp.]|uniref:serpin family protein n=1 Tax=Mucilaginibacter sp. TaxID=1882438 RepID=UPI0032644C1E
MKSKYLLWSLAITLTVFVSCKKGTGDIATDPGMDLNLNLAEQQRVVADNGFTFKLFKNLSASNTGTANLLVSPLSVNFAFGMLNNGSNGQTLSAINSTTNYNGFTQAEVNSYYSKLITDLPKLDPQTQINIANSIWYKQTFSVIPEFLATNSNYYQAKVQAADFSSPATLDVINQWVSDQTKGKIPSIIDKINPYDVMFLINAIYFKSAWNQKFDVSNTHKQAFYTNGTTAVQADFMSATVENKTYSDQDVRILELPYHNKKYSMVMVMPITKSVKEVAASLDSVQWQNWISKLHAGNNQVIIPKFKFADKATLKQPLTTLGMGVAFTPNADFTRINANGGLMISEVKHKTYIDVNEDGTEAAAVTSIGVSTTSAPVQTLIDHPFIFAIREMKTGLILFAGMVNNPLLTGN